MSDRFYFRQLLAGRDFALDDPVAGPMANYCYLIGDRERLQLLEHDLARCSDLPFRTGRRRLRG